MNIKEKLLENKGMVVFSIIFAIVITNTMIANNYEKQQLKAQLLEKSNEEIIIDLIKNGNEEVKVLDALIVETEEKKNTKVLSVECYKAQLNRFMEGLEYSIEYCDNTENLKKFSGLN